MSRQEGANPPIIEVEEEEENEPSQKPQEGIVLPKLSLKESPNDELEKMISEELKEVEKRGLTKRGSSSKRKEKSKKKKERRRSKGGVVTRTVSEMVDLVKQEGGPMLLTELLD